jgi:hypothetical protein
MALFTNLSPSAGPVSASASSTSAPSLTEQLVEARHLDVLAPKLLDSLRDRQHLRRRASISSSHVARQGTRIVSNLKSRRCVLAKERDSLVHEIATACGTVD